MKRRNFLIQGSLAASGLVFMNAIPSFARSVLEKGTLLQNNDLYDLFKNPELSYRPFVRWWWNGNKIEKAELARELRILKDAGIGGVEINPISFPSRTDDMGKPSIEWLSEQWIDLLKFTLEEAKSLGMTCDLLVGTGFPSGGAFLEDEERSQIVVIAVKKMEGPLETELSLFDLCKEADPAITNPYSGRKMEVLEVKMVPDPLSRMEEVTDLSGQIKSGSIKVSVPKGKHAVYALVKVEGFMKVIQGTPGGMGPVLNHFDGKAVRKYLNHMTDTIEKRIGPLAPDVRSFFVDSMETEGANWNHDMMSEFQKRRGYDLYPYLPFILFKIGGMGNTADAGYTVETSKDFKQMQERIRYDFELTKAELFQERFVHNFATWCSDHKIKSRAQAYGRGYFLLEGSFEIDIPECETWLKYGIGDDVSEKEFAQYPWHLGQGNTMINKYVSSAAHLKDKKLVSSEELTNTAMVFNEDLEILKIAGDQSTISGVTHPIFHGFNYSPKDAAFPGWITYGGYLNEKNNMWPFFKYYTDYRARLSALLQQATMFADIALLAPIADLWGEYGAQNEPFPTVVSPAYQMLVWEAIHQNGNACDYVSEQVIQNAEMKNGGLNYGKRKYNTLFLIEVRSLDPATAKKLYDFVAAGGRIFCMEAYPEKSAGWNNYQQRDEQVRSWVNKMKAFADRFIFLNKPAADFTAWFKGIQEQYKLHPYVRLKTPVREVTQVRYQTKQAEIFLFNNSSKHRVYSLEASFSKEVTSQKQAWLWDAATGERFKLELKEGKLNLELEPADSRLVIFDQNSKGENWKAKPLTGKNAIALEQKWSAEFRHSDGSVKTKEMNKLSDLKELPEEVNFSGTVVYRNTFQHSGQQALQYLNLGKVYGISKVLVNGKDAGTQWYGRRIYNIDHLLKKGTNQLEIQVITTMGNYMKTLKDNPVAQYWTNEKRKVQPLQSMGLQGPVHVY
jgi:hypothetical protein